MAEGEMTPTKSYIHKLNVTRFEALLQQEQSDKQRKVLSSLLAEEHVLLREALRLEQLERGADHPA
jgi:hypothetical protein